MRIAGNNDVAPEIALQRTRLVEEIRELSPTAPAGYLLRFNDRALEDYLRHLRSAAEPRGRAARWLRPGDTPAIMSFVAGDDDIAA